MPREVWDSVADEVRLLVRLSKHVAQREVAAYEPLQPAHIGVLALLVRAGEIRLTTLAERQVVDISVVSRQVSELDELGLVERVPDPADARASLLRVTPAGLARHEQARFHQRQVLRRAMGAWTDDEARQLTDALSRLNHDLAAHACARPTSSEAERNSSDD